MIFNGLSYPEGDSLSLVAACLLGKCSDEDMGKREQVDVPELV